MKRYELLIAVLLYGLIAGIIWALFAQLVPEFGHLPHVFVIGVILSGIAIIFVAKKIGGQNAGLALAAMSGITFVLGFGLGFDAVTSYFWGPTGGDRATLKVCCLAATGALMGFVLWLLPTRRSSV